MATSGGNTLDLDRTLNDPDYLGSYIHSLWNTWKSSRTLMENRWAETKKYVFATSTRDTTNAQNPWSNTTHRPKIYHIYNNLKVNTDFALFPHRDWLEFVGYDQESVAKDKRESALAYLRTKHRLSSFTKEMRKAIDDWILYGNCFVGVEYRNEFTTDPITGEQVRSYMGPKIYRISPYDIVFNAKATSFKESPKIVRIRSTMGELQRKAYESPADSYLQQVVDKMLQDRSVFAEHAAEYDGVVTESFMMDGYGTPSDYYQSGHVILHEFYGDIYDKTTGEFYKNYVITVADGRYVLRAEPLNTYSGHPHIYHCGWKERPDTLWAFGPLENLVGLQYRINHLENSKSDAFDQWLSPDKVFYGDVEIRSSNGATNYYVPENGDVRYLVPDTTVLNADLQIARLESDMELYAGAPREAVGIRSPGEKTAFEVDALMSRADRVFEYQTNIFSEFLEDLVNAELELAKINLVGSDVVSILNKEYGVEHFLSITREDLVSNGRVIPVGAREYSRKSRMAQQLNQFYATGMQDPEVSQHFPAKKIAEMWASLLDFEEIYEPYGRIPERLEAQKQQMVAQDILMEQAQIDPTGFGDMPNGQAEQLPI